MMRTTTILVSLALLGLAAAAPTASAASMEPVAVPTVPCEPTSDGNTIDNTIDLARATYCLVQPYAQEESDKLGEDVNEVLGAIQPFLDAVHAICENHAGSERCEVIEDVGGTHIDPNVDPKILHYLLASDSSDLEIWA